MIQRKQTIFLFLALVATIVCLCLQIGWWEPQGMGTDIRLYNLWIVDGQQATSFTPWGLFAILLITCPIDIVAIFDYHNRRRQARFCMFSMLMMIGWYIVYGVFSKLLVADGTFHMSFAAFLPFVSFVLLWLARRGVVADEKLVRSMDRIR